MPKERLGAKKKTWEKMKMGRMCAFAPGCFYAATEIENEAKTKVKVKKYLMSNYSRHLCYKLRSFVLQKYSSLL